MKTEYIKKKEREQLPEISLRTKKSNVEVK